MSGTPHQPRASAEPHGGGARLAALDLSLVRALVALVTEQSVSRAAEALGQSQPQLSATLRRMRAVFEDPILVRGSHGMVATEHARTLLVPAQRMLADACTLLAPPEDFEPQRLHRTIQLALPDFLSATLLAAIIAGVRAEAPNASVLVRSVRSEHDGLAMLEAGEVDLLIESSVVPAAHIRHTSLFEDRVLMVAAGGHPQLQGALTLEQYLRLPHIAAAPASGLRPGIIDRMLQERGCARRVVAWVPYLNTIPQILATSDLVFTTTAHLARHLAAHPGLQVLQPPFEFGPIRYLLMWHERVHRSGEHRWLRGLLQQRVRAALPD